MLSVIVLTKNEEKHIRDCLASVCDFADELIVLDSQSTDRTVEIARETGARIETRMFDNYPNQRNAAIDLAHGDWILFIDADERATPELGREILNRINSSTNDNSELMGYWIPRKNYICGHWVRHTGWGPDYQLRLMRRGRVRYDLMREVLELIIKAGLEGYLNNPLIHYNYDSWGEFFSRQDHYTTYEAKTLHNNRIRVKWRNFVLQPLRAFWRRYVTWKGYKDGWLGVVLSLIMAYYDFLMYVRLKRLWRASKD
jgi:glycosyltransferase involved in cell wall biosynthesis